MKEIDNIYSRFHFEEESYLQRFMEDKVGGVCDLAYGSTIYYTDKLIDLDYILEDDDYQFLGTCTEERKAQIDFAYSLYAFLYTIKQFSKEVLVEEIASAFEAIFLKMIYIAFLEEKYVEELIEDEQFFDLLSSWDFLKLIEKDQVCFFLNRKAFEIEIRKIFKKYKVD